MEKLVQLTTAEHGGKHSLHVPHPCAYCLGFEGKNGAFVMSGGQASVHGLVLICDGCAQYSRTIYPHADGALRAYPKTITNSLAEEPIFADTFSDVDIFCSHNSISLCSCNVGTTGSPLHLISTCSQQKLRKINYEATRNILV